MEQQGRLYGEVETVREFMYSGYRINEIEGCEIAETALARFRLVKFRESGEFLY